MTCYDVDKSTCYGVAGVKTENVLVFTDQCTLGGTGPFGTGPYIYNTLIESLM